MQPKRQNSKKMQYQLLRKLPILGEINIKIKVCISLKRQLIVTFNIKAVRIQISKCSHPVKLSFGGIRRLRFIYQPNLGDHAVKNYVAKTFV